MTTTTDEITQIQTEQQKQHKLCDSLKESHIYLVSVDVTDNGEFSSESVRRGISQGIGHIIDAGCMTDLGDETTIVHGFEVDNAGNYNLKDLTAAMMQIMGKTVDQTPEAGEFLRQALAQFRESFAADRLRLLSEEERTVLITGIANLRSEWEANEGSWIKSYLFNGGFSWMDQCDAVLIEEAFNTHMIIGSLYDPEEFLTAIKILSRREVIALLYPLEGNDVSDGDGILSAADLILASLKQRQDVQPGLLDEATRLLDMADTHYQAIAVEAEAHAQDECHAPSA